MKLQSKYPTYVIMFYPDYPRNEIYLVDFPNTFIEQKTLIAQDTQVKTLRLREHSIIEVKEYTYGGNEIITRYIVINDALEKIHY